MAMAIAKAGRPHAVAMINFQTDGEIQLRDDFYAACSTLTYREIMALSRGLGVHPVAVERWKYKMRFPSWHRAQEVIDWCRRGKPITLEPPWQSAADMF